MILMPDLFSFAYVPNWYSQLDMLAEMALPEKQRKVYCLTSGEPSRMGKSQKGWR